MVQIHVPRDDDMITFLATTFVVLFHETRIAILQWHHPWQTVHCKKLSILNQDFFIQVGAFRWGSGIRPFPTHQERHHETQGFGQKYRYLRHLDQSHQGRTEVLRAQKRSTFAYDWKNLIPKKWGERDVSVTSIVLLRGCIFPAKSLFFHSKDLAIGKQFI